MLLVSKDDVDPDVFDVRSAVLTIIPDDEVGRLRILSRHEAQDRGIVDESGQIVDSATSDFLPLWPETLAASASGEVERPDYASTAQEQLETPVVVTFYSLRGGVGRSTALAHSAYALAELGFSVLCLDMDLEAPGLATLFGLGDAVREGKGVVELLTEIDITEAPPNEIEEHILLVDGLPSNQRIGVIPAGKISPNYVRKLALLDPSSWYREDVNPLRVLVQSIRTLPTSLRPDVLLIDSRTGVSPIAAPLLFDVADLTIIAFYPHPQAKGGTGLLTRSLLRAKNLRSSPRGGHYTPEPRFVVSPVPASKDLRAKAVDRALSWVNEWLQPLKSLTEPVVFEDLEELLLDVPYVEATASSDVARRDALAPYEPIAEWIAGLVSRPGAVQSAESPASADAELIRRTILADLSFESHTAEQQNAEALPAILVGTEAVNAALRDDTSLVIGRKGTGKTLLFMKLLREQDSSRQSVAVAWPSSLSLPERAWNTGLGAYEAFDKAANKDVQGWSNVWRALSCLTLLRLGYTTQLPEQAPPLLASDQATRYTTAGVVKDVSSLLALDNATLVLEEWLDEIERTSTAQFSLLFDGLDTGFGNDFALRTRAVTGLMMVLNEQAQRLEALRFKAFVRHDIFRKLTFPNKTHLSALAVELAWENQYDYLRIVIRQAWRSDEFRSFATKLLAKELRVPSGNAFDLENTPIEFWRDDALLGVWRLLVGERMSGGKTAYTQNWAWTRLADAENDHYPRHLVQLFGHALRNEREMVQKDGINPKAFLRPRALIEALVPVSSDAVEAVKEEFPELADLLAALTAVGRTPFGINDLRERLQDTSQIELALEVGLIGRTVEDGTYRVPDLYRHGLSMTRMGAA